MASARIGREASLLLVHKVLIPPGVSMDDEHGAVSLGRPPVHAQDGVARGAWQRGEDRILALRSEAIRSSQKQPEEVWEAREGRGRWPGGPSGDACAPATAR